jgi:hypothetical protein
MQIAYHSLNQIGLNMNGSSNQLKNFKVCLKIGALSCAFIASSASAATLSREEFRVANNLISSDYTTAKTSCGALKDNAKDICMQQAKGKYKVSKAELENKDEPSPKHLRSVSVAKADSIFEVAKEKCDDSAGNAKSVCKTEAKAAHNVALADAKMLKVVTDAKADDAQVKRDEDYKVASEKCDILNGDAKTACTNSAKTKFNKM